MLPGENKPWARTVAASVIALSVVGAIGLGLYFRSIGSLHVSEIVGIFLLLLTIIPPNAAILMRKAGEDSLVHHNLHNTTGVNGSSTG